VNKCREENAILPVFVEDPHLRWLFTKHTNFTTCLTALVFFDRHNVFLQDAVQELDAFNAGINDELMNEALQLLSAIKFLRWIVKFHQFIAEPIGRESFRFLEYLVVQIGVYQPLNQELSSYRFFKKGTRKALLLLYELIDEGLTLGHFSLSVHEGVGKWLKSQKPASFVEVQRLLGGLARGGHFMDLSSEYGHHDRIDFVQTEFRINNLEN
jgi:hypothetical protein